MRYDPARVGVEAMFAAIEREGFKGRVVPAPTSLRPEGLKLDVATLPADLKQLFADAAAQDRRVLVDIHGPG
ncbi:MAG: hypothetical protein KF696_14910 [Planctomycetes bacterium]|nr:hypothetical protein [Planctomycetota bacterium]MCW8135857.1 hypothetical protein [Planctomycetota bacterium]